MFFTLALLLLACSPKYPTQKITLTASDGQIAQLHVEIADEPMEWQQGLMRRKKLVSDGMLFVFPGATVQSFWMKDTLMPLDILFFDADGRFVALHRMDPCTEDPCPVYSSGKPAQYALEVPAGTLPPIAFGDSWKLEY